MVSKPGMVPGAAGAGGGLPVAPGTGCGLVMMVGCVIVGILYRDRASCVFCQCARLLFLTDVASEGEPPKNLFLESAKDRALMLGRMIARVVVYSRGISSRLFRFMPLP